MDAVHTNLLIIKFAIWHQAAKNSGVKDKNININTFELTLVRND